MKVLVILIISFSITISANDYEYGKEVKSAFDSGNISLAVKTNEKIASNLTKEYWYGKFLKYNFDRGDIEKAFN